jgi:hypothetical protein
VVLGGRRGGYLRLLKNRSKLECLLLASLSSLVYTLQRIGAIHKLRKNEVLWICSRGVYSKNFIIFVTYECAQ